MGGQGSGRRGWRVTVEGTGALVLDVNEVTRPVKEALRRAGLRGGAVPNGRQAHAEPFGWSLRRDGEAEPWAVVKITLWLGARRGCATTSHERFLAHRRQ